MSGWLKWILIAVAAAALYDFVLRPYLAKLLSADLGASSRRADSIQ